MSYRKNCSYMMEATDDHDGGPDVALAKGCVGSNPTAYKLTVTDFILLL